MGSRHEGGRSFDEKKSDLPVDFLVEAQLDYRDQLPPFIDTHQAHEGCKDVLPVYSAGASGSWPNPKSRRPNIELIRRVWSGEYTYWTLDWKGTRHIVHGIPANGKIDGENSEDIHQSWLEYRIWTPRGFGSTSVAFEQLEYVIMLVILRK